MEDALQGVMPPSALATGRVEEDADKLPRAAAEDMHGEALNHGTRGKNARF